MEKIDSIEVFEKVIDCPSPIGILFSASDCSTCKALALKLKDEENFFEIDIEKWPAVVGIAHVFSAPTIAIYLNKKQINVFSGVFSLDEVLGYIDRIKNYVCA